jgi:hypothetical protein
MLARAAKVGLIIGVLLAGMAVYALSQGSSAAPTCDGRQMSAMDKCITHYADGHTVTKTYAQAKGQSGATLGWVLLIGGVAVGGASLYGLGHSRRPSRAESAPSSRVEVPVGD